jgi:hypothetical protein
MSNSLNPNHPTVRALDGHWDKICALIVKKAGGHVAISAAEIEALVTGPEIAMTVQDHDGVLHLRIVPLELGRAIAKREGGLPS